MRAQDQVRRCRCGTQLARDNRSHECHVCQRSARDHRLRPPQVPVSFWQSPPMQAALASHDMGAVIHAFRNHPIHGAVIPQEVVAGWADLSQSGLSRIEHGEHAFTEAKLMRWAHILGMPADVRWFSTSNGNLPTDPDMAEPDQEADAAVPPRFGHRGTLLLPVLVNGQPVLVPINASCGVDQLGPDLVATVSEWNSMSSLDRRTFLQRGIATAALPGFGLDELHHIAKALDNAGCYLDGAVVDYFRQQLMACAADDGALGPKKTLPVVLAIVQAVAQHACDVPPAVRRDLLVVGAQGAEFAGWLFRDARDPVQASYWRDRATEWAQEAGDTAMQGYVLLKKAQAAYDNRDALRMLTLAQAARDGPWDLPLRVRAEAAQQEARGHAMLGTNHDLVERKLAEAHQLLTDADCSAAVDDRPLGMHYNETLLTMQTAICYCEGGHPRRAVELYDSWLSAQHFSRRDYGYFQALRSAALALAGEPDTAATAGMTALSVATETASQRTTQELRSVVEVLRPWASRPAVRELREAVLA